MTKAELRTRTKQAVGNRTSTTVTDTWYDERVLNAYKQLVTYQGQVSRPGGRQPQFRILRFPQLEDRLTRSLTSALTSNFVANQTAVELVDDIFDRTTNRGMDRESERRIRQLDPDEVGIPRRWEPASEGGVDGYYIWPRPNAAEHNIDVYEYVVLTPVLVADGDSPLIPAEWHQAITYLAASEAAALFDMSEKSGEMRQNFMGVVSSLQAPNELRAAAGLAGNRRRIRVGQR